MIAATRKAIDVSELPESVLDHRSLVWWGNLALIAIETTMFALIVSAYFYVRPNYTQWPPPLPNPIGRIDPVPELGLPTVSLGVLLLTLAPMIFADRACLRRDERAVKRALAVFLLLALGVVALRFREFSALRFRWDENAYASIVWTMVGLHLLHLIVGVLEIVMMLAWAWRNGLDVKHARDVRVTAVYWYWIVGTWIILYAIIFPGPRFY